MFEFVGAGLAEIAATEIPKAAAAVTPALSVTAAPEAAAAAVQAVESAGAGLFTAPQITAAVIAGVVSVIIALLTNRREKRQLFSNIVSRERMTWVREVRALCTELCAICEMYDAETIVKEPDKLLAFFKARSGLLLHLSPWNIYTTDNEMIMLLNPLDPEPDAPRTAQPDAPPVIMDQARLDFQKVKANCPQIRKLLTKICKLEWDKVKLESGSSKAKRKIEKMQKSLRVKTVESASPTKQ